MRMIIGYLFEAKINPIYICFCNHIQYFVDY